MDNYYEQLKAWKWLQGQLQAIPDPSLRKMYHDTFVLKAIKEWGFNPEHPEQRPPKETLSEQDLIKYLEPWEQELLKRIKIYNEYGIDTKPKDEKERESREAYLNMYNFVKGGGTLADIPEDLRSSDHIQNLYFKALKKVYDV